jgi:hypothetical protein
VGDQQEIPRFPPGGRSTRDYWLSHSHGFRVESGGGRVGIVEEVLYARRHDCPDTLVVRSGVLGRNVVLVATDDVAAIDPRSRRISVRHAGTGVRGSLVGDLRRRLAAILRRAPS